MITTTLSERKFLKDIANNTKEKPLEKQNKNTYLFKELLEIANGRINPITQIKIPKVIVEKVLWLRNSNIDIPPIAFVYF